MTIHLSILLFFPLAFALLGALLPRGARAGGAAGRLARHARLRGPAAVRLRDRRAGLQYVTDDAWIEELGIRYTLGVDGLNLWLIALTTLLFAASALWITLRPPGERAKLFVFHIGLAETAVLGAFVAQDLLLFVLFFDLMLVPFYFLVGQWGGAGPRRGDVQARRLHAGRLAADARRGGRDRRARPRPDGRRDLLDRRRSRAPRSERARSAGSSSRSRSRS